MKRNLFLLSLVCLQICVAQSVEQLEEARFELSEHWSKSQDTDVQPLKVRFGKSSLIAYEAIVNRSFKQLIVYFDETEAVRYFPLDSTLLFRKQGIEQIGSSYQPIGIDYKRNFAYGLLTSQDAYSLYGISLCKKGIYTFQYSTMDSLNASDSSAFKEIMHSIRHQLPYSYIPSQEEKAGKYKKEMESSGFWMTVFGAIAIGGWLIRKYLM